MKALFINPKMASGWPPYVMPPIGLGYLKACLLKEGFNQIKVVDMGGLKVESVREIIHAESPEVVGITTFTEARHNALRAVAIAKEINPRVKTILGGVHATVMYQQVMENYPAVDIICRGESERTIVELFQALSNNDNLSKVRGIVYRQDGEIVVTEEREKIRDLDTLPFPNYDDLDLKKYRDVDGLWKGKSVASIITSRGCPFSCSYCSSRSVWGNWRPRSISNVLDEIEWLVSEYGYEMVSIVDDIFTLKKARIEEFCQGLLNRGLRIEWRSQTRADCLSPEMLELMRETGCQRLTLGIESGSPTILKNLNKKQEIEDVVNAFAWCKKAGIKAGFNVIIGAPGETRATIEETKNVIVTHPHSPCVQ
ncbi:Anaerobic magnesium-protoporphyrin IX monomethyl ester cyclase [subsurface metagenome]